MSVLVNGDARELAPGAVVADVVGDLTGAARPRGVAVAVNGAVVPRTQWAVTTLYDGDSVEVLTAVQGG
jgi:sulfur carrier protein